MPTFSFTSRLCVFIPCAAVGSLRISPTEWFYSESKRRARIRQAAKHKVCKYFQFWAEQEVNSVVAWRIAFYISLRLVPAARNAQCWIWPAITVRAGQITGISSRLYSSKLCLLFILNEISLPYCSSGSILFLFSWIYEKEHTWRVKILRQTCPSFFCTGNRVRWAGTPYPTAPWLHRFIRAYTRLFCMQSPFERPTVQRKNIHLSWHTKQNVRNHFWRGI